jgi:hypothetical protein
MRMLAAVCALAFVFTFSIFTTTAYAFDEPVITLESSFVDSEGRLNVVGTVRNYADAPVQVTVGVETDDGRTVKAPTYGRVIWPLTDAPFKIALDRGVNASDPFIMDVREAQAPNYNNMLVLNYGSMAVGEERAFVGTIKNTGPFEAYNVSVFAGVHSPDHKSQLETVRSNVIPVIKPGQEVEFKAVPDQAVVSDAFYYSCAGLDYDEPITTIKTGDGRFIAYNLNAVAQVTGMRYEDSTDSIAFGIRPYAPNGGPLTLQIPQLSQNQSVMVMLDGKLHEASVNGDGKTLSIDFFVPKGDHQVEVQGVRNMPEFPFVALALAAVTGVIIAAARLKAAFKIY